MIHLPLVDDSPRDHHGVTSDLELDVLALRVWYGWYETWHLYHPNFFVARSASLLPAQTVTDVLNVCRQLEIDNFQR